MVKRKESENKGDCEHCPHPDFEYFDLFEIASLVDNHLDTDLTEEDLARRLLDATENAKKMGSSSSLNIEEELDELLKPRLRWQDFIRHYSHQKRIGQGRSDWNSFKTRPLFAGLYIPKKKDYHLRILIGLDRSGSVSKDDAIYGLSQCQVIDYRAEAIVVCWDTEVKWKEAARLKKVDATSLQEIRSIGGGGTDPLALFQDYKQQIGEVDLIILITDGIFDWDRLKEIKLDSKVDVCWILTMNNSHFSPPFGRVFNLHNL